VPPQEQPPGKTSSDSEDDYTGSDAYQQITASSSVQALQHLPLYF
jgi:hypothetical protein